MHVVLSRGETLTVEFDGQGDKFEIHLNTQTEPNAVAVLRKRGATFNADGHIPAVLYRRMFAAESSYAEGSSRPRRSGFFCDAAGKVHCTMLVHCAVVQSKLGDYFIVETLNADDEVTGEFDFYETMRELEDVLGHPYPQLTI